MKIKDTLIDNLTEQLTEAYRSAFFIFIAYHVHPKIHFRDLQAFLFAVHTRLYISVTSVRSIYVLVFLTCIMGNFSTGKYSFGKLIIKKNNKMNCLMLTFMVISEYLDLIFLKDRIMQLSAFFILKIIIIIDLHSHITSTSLSNS